MAQTSDIFTAHEPDLKQRLREIQLERHFANTRVSMLGSMINAAVLVVVYAAELSPVRLGGWFACVVLVVVARVIVARLRARDPGRWPLGVWYRLQYVLVCLSGLSWGLGAVLLLPQLSALSQIFFLLIFGGILAGASAYLAPIFGTFVLYAVVTMLPMQAVLFFIAEHRTYLATSLVLFLFLAMVLGLSYRSHREFIQLHLLRLRNDNLLASLNESEYLFRTLIENSPTAVILVQDERFIYFNPAAGAVTGYTQDELRHRKFWEIAHPDDQDRIRTWAERRMKNSGDRDLPARYVFKIIRKDGRVAWIDFTPVGIDFRGGKAILGSCLDITERMEDQEARRESEERYRTLVESANDSIFIVALDDRGEVGTFVDVNTQACARLGYSRDELLLLTPADITHEYEKSFSMEMRQRLLREGLLVFELEHLTKDRRRCPVEVSAQLTTYEGRRAVLCVVRDIGERKEAERQLRAAMRQAELANAAKSAFLASMSHEIRTPLNGVLGMLQLLRMGELDQERDQYLAVAVSSGESLLAIINDILDLSKIEAGKFEIAAAVFDARVLMESIRDSFSFACRNTGVDLVLNLDPSVPRFLLSDQARLRQIMYNLVGNAVKFSRAGSIRIEMVLDSRRGDTGMVEIRIADTGVGIPEDQQAGLFEPFVQARSATKTSASGTGLGLSIVKRIAAYMGGDVWLTSTEGRGTTVFVRIEVGIPKEDRDFAAREREGRSCAVPGRHLHVLVAEDNSVNELMIRKSLEKLGHACVCVSNGEAVLERLRRERFDCVLMDIQMPGLDGVEVTRRIRDRVIPEIDPDIHIIALTAYALSGDREKFLAQGMDNYLAKPVSIAELSAALCQVVPEHSSPP